MGAEPGIAVLDYEAGNLRSVETALRFLGADFAITRDPELVARARRLIVPGVGEARAAMEVLNRTGLARAVRDFFVSGRPILGICIGTQLIFTYSEERDTPCLDLLAGTVKRFEPYPGLKVPHMGWNRVFIRQQHPVLAGVPEGTYFYFVHSYYPEPQEQVMVIAECEYGNRFACGLAWGNLVAFQFHPEKSGRIGLKLLENFLDWEPA